MVRKHNKKPGFPGFFVFWRPVSSYCIQKLCWYFCWYRSENANCESAGYQQMALTDTNIKAIKAGKTQKKYSDSGGLYLLVKPSGSKLWQMAYRFGGKQKTLSFGPYPIVSLADARRKRDDTKRLLVSGADPYQQNRLE